MPAAELLRSPAKAWLGGSEQLDERISGVVPEVEPSVDLADIMGQTQAHFASRRPPPVLVARDIQRCRIVSRRGNHNVALLLAAVGRQGDLTVRVW
jgi:hypothetical protein